MRMADIIFSPPSQELLVFLLALLTAIGCFCLWRRMQGGVLRILLLLLAVLLWVDPQIIDEKSKPRDDIVFLVADRSLSENFGNRRQQTTEALASLQADLDQFTGLETQLITITSDQEKGTLLMGVLRSAMDKINPDRFAGAIIITDGRVHDPKSAPDQALGPIHVLLTGRRDAYDRRVTLVKKPDYAVVGNEAILQYQVLDTLSHQGQTPVVIRVDGEIIEQTTIQLGAIHTIEIPIKRAGDLAVEIEIPPVVDELTAINNHIVALINGVRENLRVLLISGEPHAGERVWRDILRSDHAVDLLHFTILRTRFDDFSVPPSELSLIPFPVRQLFQERLDEFDLIIFDRYRNFGLLRNHYINNIVEYVETGGALLVLSGPAYAGRQGLYNTPMKRILPAEPTGDVYNDGFIPMLSEAGLRHPVTTTLTGTASDQPGKNKQWGRWFRVVKNNLRDGVVLMRAFGVTATPAQQTAQGKGEKGVPLIVVNRAGEGRIAQILSDQLWLWAREFEGGGPYGDILRRLAHWLMKEPELEEERLLAHIADDRLHVTRYTMQSQIGEAQLRQQNQPPQDFFLREQKPGLWQGSIKIEHTGGLIRVGQDDLSVLAGSSVLDSKEYIEPVATEEILAPIAAQSGGGVFWLRDSKIRLRRIKPGSRAFGGKQKSAWIGLERRAARQVTGVEYRRLFPPILAICLFLALAYGCWFREGR